MRVWAAVRNQPGSTVQEILSYLKTDKRASVASALTVLEFFEVVYSTGDGGNKSPKKYFTPFEKYDPIKASHHQYRKSTMSKTLKLNTPSIPMKMITKPVPMDTPKAGPDRIEVLFDSLTLNECRELYQRLHVFFG